MTRAAILRLAIGWLTIGSGCADTERSERDQAVMAAIERGAWPEAAETIEQHPKPLEVDPEHLRHVLGDFEYQAEVTYRYTGEAPPDGADRYTPVVPTEEAWLSETCTLRMTRAGHYDLAIQRRWRRPDDPPGRTGRQARYDGTRLVTRHNAGEWMERDPLRARPVDEAFAATRHLPVLMRLLAPGLEQHRVGPQINLTSGTWRPPPRAADEMSTGAEWERWWQRSHRPDTLGGQLSLQADGRALASAVLTFTARTSRPWRPREVLSLPEDTAGPSLFAPGTEPVAEGVPDTPPEAPSAGPRPATLEVTLAIRVLPLDSPPVVAIPEQVMQPNRRRIGHMVQSIIGGGP